jgi:hypothetical protein
MRADAASGRRRARAFGLELDLSFPAPGLPAATGPAVGRHTRVDLVGPDEIDRDWPAHAADRVLEERFGRKQPERTIDIHPRAGYRLYARHFGLARISARGARVLCSPPGVAPWRWQRFLVGRVLPWAAVLRGLEPLHASAVQIDGRAVALVGQTGAGKTSLALQLVARGAGFMSDDVLALDDGQVLRAHPGAGVAAVRPAERAAIPRATWRRVGTVLGHSGKTYMELPRPEQPAPLGAVYFLNGDDGPVLEPITQPDPRLLLASTFVLGVQTPERLLRQLDVCAAIVRSVPLYCLRPAASAGSAELAELVDHHARETLGELTASAA